VSHNSWYVNSERRLKSYDVQLRDAGFRIVPVTDISSVAFVLDWLDQTTGGARVKVTPTQEHAAALVNACCTIPQLGKKTCLEKVRSFIFMLNSWSIGFAGVASSEFNEETCGNSPR